MIFILFFPLNSRIFFISFNISCFEDFYCFFLSSHKLVYEQSIYFFYCSKTNSLTYFFQVLQNKCEDKISCYYLGSPCASGFDAGESDSWNNLTQAWIFNAQIFILSIIVNLLPTSVTYLSLFVKELYLLFFPVW